MTFYNTTCNANCGAIIQYVMLSLISQSCYDSDHDYWVSYISIFKYVTYIFFDEDKLLSNLLPFFPIT